MKQGIALITVIWILAILTVLLGIVLFLTTSDIAYTFIFNKQKTALAAAEDGKNDVISKIPCLDLLGAMAANDFLFHDGVNNPAFRSLIRGNRFFLITPMPFPHGTLKWGTGGKWLKTFDFNAGGRFVSGKGDIEKVINIGAAYVNPMTAAGSIGHTMY